jgi:hypothetical protein
MGGNQSDISSTNSQISPVPIKITYGYSRDHRPDLKQFILDLICSGDGADGVTGCLKNRQGVNPRQIASKKIG